LEISWRGDPITGSGTISMKLNRLYLPEAFLREVFPDETDFLKRMGYSDLAVDLGYDATLSNDGIDVDLDGNFYLSVRDMGSIQFFLNISNLPVALLETLLNMKNNAPAPEEFFRQAGGTVFHYGAIRFRDMSLTNRILIEVAKLQKMQKKDLIKNLNALAIIMMRELRAPEFSKKASSAIDAYLAKPKSIMLAAKPTSRLTINRLMSLDPKNPANLIGTIGLGLTTSD
jgi:hypothetical protein